MSTPYFHIRVKTKDKELVAAVMLSELVKACQEHAPAEARYIEQLHWYVANGGRADFMLIQAMEDEGFEVERLMLIYLENKPWWEHLRHEGRDPESMRLDAILYPDSELAQFEKLLFNFMVGPTIETSSAIAIAQAFQLEVWKTFPAMEDLHQKEVAEFIEKTSKVAEYFLTDEAAEYDEYLDSGFKFPEGPFQAEFEQSLEGIQKEILDFRQRSGKGPVNPSPITVEIVEIVNQWEHEADNKVKIWYKATCKEGVFYHNAYFKYLVQQAALYFPESYYKIEALRESIVAVRPKEKEIVEALQAEQFDLTPMLASYVNECVDAALFLSFEKTVQSRNQYENSHDEDVKNRSHYGPGLERARKVNLLIDRLEDLAYNMISQYFPDMIKSAKPWMKKSLRRSAHLLVFEVMDKVWGLISQSEKMAA